MTFFRPALAIAITIAIAAIHILSYAQTAVDCEIPANAEAYAADYKARFKNAVADAKAKETARRNAYEALTKRTVEAGMWTRPEADAFRLQLSANMPALQELEAKRDKAAKEVSMAPYSMLATESISSANPQAGQRLTCIMGQEIFVNLALQEEAANAVEAMVAAQVAQEAKKKGLVSF